MEINLSNFTPDELGLPDKFTAFRKEQIESVEWIVNSPARYMGACIPTGGGKSLVALAAAKASGRRTIILTSTKGLEDQYYSDFSRCGLVDIRGKANYPCADKSNLSCRFGPHEGCRYSGKAGCTYECARDEARAADIVVTNYAYWIAVNKLNRGLDGDDVDSNPFELLICDEGHKTMEELSKSLQVQLKERWLMTARIKFGTNRKISTVYRGQDELQFWVKLAFDEAPYIEEQLKFAKIALREKPNQANRTRVYELEELLQAFSGIMRMNSNDWVCEMREGTQWGRVWDFDSVWPGQFAESRLFLGIPKVVILSATLRPQALTMLGINKSEFSYREWPRIFPAKNTPIYHLKTVRLNHRSTDDDIRKWLENIDAIIDGRVDRKGLIHTVSYSRQQYLLANSRHARHMVANTNDPDSPTALETVARFKSMDAPAILVSPSFSTGWDFPDDECRWQIIAKVAFPDSRSKVMTARVNQNKRYLMYLAMQDFIQACGRGSRSYEDWCEVFIVDDSIEWFMHQNKTLAPSGFNIIPMRSVPKPLYMEATECVTRL